MEMYDIPTFWLIILLRYGWIIFALVMVGFVTFISGMAFWYETGRVNTTPVEYRVKCMRWAKLLTAICVLSFFIALMMPSYYEALHLIANEYCGAENVSTVVEQVNTLKYGISTQPEYIEGEY